MATLAETVAPPPVSADDRFFRRAAIVMALAVVTGFSVQFLAGRSSFSSPPRVHAHAVVFMGWVAIYVAQNVLATTGRIALHRKLGWIAAGWTVAMVVMGCWVTVAMIRGGNVPFFFPPVQFLVFDPMTVFFFAGLTWAAIRLRHRTDWHRRLHYCGMSLLLGPAFGRLLPMPFLIPWAFECTFAVLMIFPIIGVIADKRRTGAVHPAWGWGIGALVASLLLTEAVTYSPVGVAIYDAVAAGSPGEKIDPYAYPPPPMGPQITGRQ